jgi:hypothetical protein
MKTMNKVSLGIAAMMLAGSIATPALAASVGIGAAQEGVTEATTGVYLVDDSGKIKISAPTEIHVSVKADGDFITPSADVCRITNYSPFAARVASAQFSEESSFKLVLNETRTSQAEAADSANDFKVNFRFGADGTASFDAASYVNNKLTLSGDAFNMEDVTQTDKNYICLTTDGWLDMDSGEDNNLDLTKDQKFTTISWEFAAGKK